MRIPQMVLLTNLPIPGRPVGPIAVRSDTIMIIERTTVKIEEKITKGVSTVKTNLPGAVVEGTCLHLATGGQVFVAESVEEVAAVLRMATKGWFA